MARINLLPWRAERRKERQRQFLSVLGGAAILMVLIVVYAHFHINTLFEYQRQRNTYLTNEIDALDQKIKEIKKLEATKAKLLARMDIIQQLQESRPQIVHLFDELAKTVPEGVYLTRIAHQGKALTVEGIAQSNARVSAYMHNLDRSAWLEAPKLQVIESQSDSHERVSRFTLEVMQVTEIPGASEAAS